jgi:periplasmic divalent cation tolerance protein
MSILIVLATVTGADAARSLAQTLVAERLAACVNRIPVQSTYRWEGRLCEEAELLLVIKTTRERFDALKARFESLHDYEVPELIALDASAGLERYAAWVAAATTPA